MLNFQKLPQKLQPTFKKITSFTFWPTALSVFLFLIALPAESKTKPKQWTLVFTISPTQQDVKLGGFEYTFEGALQQKTLMPSVDLKESGTLCARVNVELTGPGTGAGSGADLMLELGSYAERTLEQHPDVAKERRCVIRAVHQHHCNKLPCRFILNDVRFPLPDKNETGPGWMLVESTMTTISQLKGALSIR